MSDKILIPLFGDDVAPRFDLATEVLITSTDLPEDSQKERIIVLPQASAENLCHLVMTEGIDVVICGGIEDEYYRYLVWKKVSVYDSVIGEWKAVIKRYRQQTLRAGDNLFQA